MMMIVEHTKTQLPPLPLLGIISNPYLDSTDVYLGEHDGVLVVDF